jgi:hypothetical protein
MEIIEGPSVVTRPGLPYVGIRVVNELLSELRGRVEQLGLSVQGHGFLRLHVIDMAGLMDVEVGLLTPERAEYEGRLCSGVLAAGRYATLTYKGVGTGANRALLEWARSRELFFDRWDVPEGDRFACRYEAYLTDPGLEPRKKRWEIELAFKLVA